MHRAQSLVKKSLHLVTTTPVLLLNSSKKNLELFFFCVSKKMIPLNSGRNKQIKPVALHIFLQQLQISYFVTDQLLCQSHIIKCYLIKIIRQTLNTAIQCYLPANQVHYSNATLLGTLLLLIRYTTAMPHYQVHYSS